MLKIFATLTLLAACVPGSAQVVINTVDDAWRYADEHNVSIRSAGYDLQKAVAARRQAYMAYLPQAGINASFTDYTALPVTLVPAFIVDRNASPDEVRQVQFGQKYIYTAGVTAQLDLINPQTWYNTQTAKATEALNRATVANARKLAYQQIANQYYAYLLSREAERLAAISVRVADSVLESVNNKFSEGAVSMSNVDMARINTERVRQTYINAVYQARLSNNALKGLLNLSVTDSLLISGSLRSEMLTDPSGSFKDDPAISIAAYQSQISYTAQRAARAGILPTLSLAYSNTVQQNNNEFEPFRGGTTFPAAYFALRANWNLFTAGNRWLQVQRSKINAMQSQLQYDNARKQSAMNDENLALNYRKAAALLKNAENIMQLSADNYRHVSARYTEGLSSIEERLNVFNDYISYQNQYLNSLSELLVQLFQVKIRQQSF